MTEHEQQEQAETETEALPDLDISRDEAELVKGGRRGDTSDPCEGGE